MPSKNKFEINGEIVFITSEGWDKLAHTTYREDYYPELSSVTWSQNGAYLRNSKLGYLHRYIAAKWYGVDMLKEMDEAGWIVDHMNNDGFDCQIENLSFLSSDENKAKGFTVDKQSEEMKYHIALNLFRDFSTGCFQITMFFNDEVALCEGGEMFCVSSLRLLYDTDYRIVINDTRDVLLSYTLSKKFDLSKLHHKEYKYEKAFYTTLKPEEKGAAVVERDGKMMLLINEHTKMLKVNYDKGWLPNATPESNGEEK